MKQDNQKGFTFVEILIATLIISSSFVALFALNSSNVASGDLAQQRYVASNLAQEGIEVISNIRHTNWLQCSGDRDAWRGVGCNDGIDLSAGTYLVQYDSDQDTDLIDASGGTDTTLYRDSNNNYCHPSISCSGSADSSLYSRTVEIVDNPNGCSNSVCFGVKSQVTWSFRGKNYDVTLYDVLFNWR